MEIFWKYLFIICLAILVYNYLGYSILASLIALFRKNKAFNTDWSKNIHVTVIIPAYNEAGLLQEKLTNTLNALTPFDQFQIVLITDGSNDGSENITIESNKILHLHSGERKGKSAAINRAVQHSAGDIIVITDANAFINDKGFVHLISRFEDIKTGAVSGEKKVLSTNGSTGGEGIYWKYESFVKLQSAKMNSLTGAAGELIAFRKELFKPLPEDAILDDLELSFQIIRKNKKIDYEPLAYVTEPPSKSIKEEFSRKVRIAAGVFQTLVRNPFVFNPFKHSVFIFQFFSHRLLRWVVGPPCILLLFISNIMLMYIYRTEINIFTVIGLLQVLFYMFVLIGFLLRNSKNIPSVLFVPFYFIMTNTAISIGFFRYLGKKETVLWKKASR